MRSLPATAHLLELPDGRELAGRRFAGRGEPLVLLHGLLDSAEGWDRLARTTPRPCVAFDLPGFGGFDLPQRPRVTSYAEDLLYGLDQLGVERFALVGHSFGGAVATAVAERAADQIAALVLLAPADFGRIHLAEAVTVPGVRDLTRMALPRALANPLALKLAYMAVVTNGHTLPADVLQRVRGRAGTSVDGARVATRAVVAAGLSQHAFHRRRIPLDAPVWALWGSSDRLVPPSHAAGVRRAFPRAQVEVWKGMGHHPQHERAAQLAHFVTRSCSSARPAAPRPALEVAA
jgi:pimeloyl-ACP methyl ester carboxylesterase